MLRPTTKRGEQGQILAILALALIVIIGFAALAVDLGNLAQSKQHTQNAVDAAALSGAQELGAAGGSPNYSSIVSSVESYLDKNYSGAGTPSWNSCNPSVPVTPPGTSESMTWITPLSNDSSGNAQNCIVFGTGAGSSQTNTIQVELPPQFVKYALAQVVGQGSGANIASISQASVGTSLSIAGLPIAVGNTNLGSGYSCLKGGNGNNSCDQPSLPPAAQGIVVNPRYRLFPNAKDNGGGNNSAVEINLSLGIDHELQPFNASDASHFCDAKDSPYTSACPNAAGYYNASVNSGDWDLSSLIYVDTGNTNNTTPNGLACGDTGGRQGVDATDGIYSLAPRLANTADPTSGTPNTTNPSPGDSPSSPTINSVTSGFCNSSSWPTVDGRQISCYLTTQCGETPESSSAIDTTYGFDFSTVYGTTSCVTTSGTNTPPDPSTCDVQNTAWGPSGGASSGDAQLGTDLVNASATAWTAVGNNQTPVPVFPASMANSPRFAIVPVVPTGCQGMCEITPDPPVAPYGFADVYLDYSYNQGNDFSINAFIFSPYLVDGGPLEGSGQSLQTYHGGPFSVHLCSLTAKSGTGNC